MSNSNARLIEKDIMEDLTTTGGDSEIVDLNGASKFSCQAVYDVSAPDPEDFESPETAALVNQSLTYTAVDAGVAGNDITIELVDTGVPDQALEVSVVGSAISVNLELDSGVASELVVQDLTYTAVDVGVAGDDITIEYVDDVVSGPVTVDVTTTHIVVHMESGTSTATEIKDAVDGTPAALLLVSVAITGTGSNTQTDMIETPLAGGADPDIVSTGNDVKAAINADSPGAADLVLVSGTNASVVTALVPTNLINGTDGDVNLDDNLVTLVDSVFATGLKVQLTSTGTLPSPLLTATDYFLIKVDDDLFQFAETLEDALAGTPIVLLDAGSNGAVNTVTAEALSGASFTFQKSNDRVNWINIQAATSVTVDGSEMLQQPDVSYRYFKVVKALDSGVFDLQCYVLVIGPAV